MFSAIEIRGFRCFEHMRASGLTRVNLFVGRNNAGKTSLLEAVEVLATGGFSGLLEGLRRRHEFLPAIEGSPAEIDVVHLFHEHAFRLGSKFSIHDAGSRASVSGEIVEDAAVSACLELRTTDSPRGGRRELSSRGGIPESNRLSLAVMDQVHEDVRFLNAGADDWRALAELWDDVQLTPEEQRLKELLQTLEPSLEGVAFPTGAGKGGPMAQVKLTGQDRMPLGSAGEGMRRLLSLGLHLVHAGDGVLLVDDIDTGLHYSAMESMWRFVIEGAIRLDAQVFATTHSLDCVRSLARVSGANSETTEVASVHRIERGTRETVRYAIDEVAEAAQHHVEVR